VTEELAIISGVRVGMRDCHNPVVSFSVRYCDGLASLQVLSWEEAGMAIKEAWITDLSTLEGKTCVVERKDNYAQFVRFSKAKP
jgi:hypothetical protein